MNSTEHSSYWIESTMKTDYGKSDKNMIVDTAIIGGGICGLTTALLLKERGQDLAIFEAKRIGCGATGYTSAKITIQHGTIYQDIISSYGKEAAKKYARGNSEAALMIKNIIDKYHIECDYDESDSYVYARTEKELERLKKEYEAVIDLDIKAAFLSEIEEPFYMKGALAFKNQAMFHPRKYILGIAKCLDDNQIYENTRIVNIESEKDFYCLETADGNIIQAKHVVIATKYPIINKKDLFFTKLHVERSYIIAVSSTKIKLSGMYISVDKPVRSVRPCKTQKESLILIGGANHPVGECHDTSERYNELIAYAKELDESVEVKYKWSTQDCISLDKIPYIGEINDDMKNIYVATGFSKWGMTNGTIGARLITDKILGIKNEFEGIFDPKRRLSLKSIKELAVQGIDVAQDYISTLLNLDVDRFSDVGNGEGKLAKYKDKVVGVYRDNEGEIYVVNPKCPHMGCQLSFNQAEKTWDCPCHGSRFNYNGKVIEAPSVRDLDLLNDGGEK